MKRRTIIKTIAAASIATLALPAVGCGENILNITEAVAASLRQAAMILTNAGLYPALASKLTLAAKTADELAHAIKSGVRGDIATKFDQIYAAVDAIITDTGLIKDSHIRLVIDTIIAVVSAALHIIAQQIPAQGAVAARTTRPVMDAQTQATVERLLRSMK